MARPRDFDLDAAIDTATALFWKRGFAGTSVRELCDAMGLQSGSFYAAFGSKEACFRAALARYLETQGLPRGPSLSAIVGWFKAIVAPKRRGLGCLLVNSAVEITNLDEESAAFVHGRMKAMEGFFEACLAGRPNVKEDALLLTSVVIAIHVRQRAGASRGELDRLVKRALHLTEVDEAAGA